MRVAGVVLAVLLVAACPPRRARVVYYAVPACPAPAAPVMPAPVPPAPVPAARMIDPAVEQHLAQWEKRTASVTNMRTEVALTRTDAVFKTETNYTGVVLLMRPNFAVLRLDTVGDATKADYEAYICDGKALYAYSGERKTITEFALPPGWPLRSLSAAGNPVLDLLTNVKATDAAERFDVSLIKEDANYVYLDIKPRSNTDKAEFQQVRLALFKPGPAVRFAYLPAKVYVLKPNGDSEQWKFTNPQVNLPGVDEKAFRFVPVKGWEVRKGGAGSADKP
jgi:TIGR03009 family protein